MTNDKRNRTAMTSMLITLKAIAKLENNKNLETLVRVSGPFFLKAEKAQHLETWNEAQQFEFAQGVGPNGIEEMETWENFEQYFKQTFKTN